MTILRSIPRSRKMPSLRNVVMIDAVRGVLRVRRWPRKYGKPRSALQAWWVDWFRQANLLAKYVDGPQQARAIEMTKGSGLYPRDVILKAMRGRLYVWADARGWKWYPMAAIQDISDSLDVLAQTVGSILVRAADRWRAPPAGILGDVLMNQGPAAPPTWETLTPGAGVVTQELAGTPIATDNTVNQYILDVTQYAAVTLRLDSIAFPAASYCEVQLSVDDGVTYKNGASDYDEILLTAGTELWRAINSIRFTRALGAGSHNCVGILEGLRAGKPTFGADVAYSTNQAGRRSAQMNFLGPVTHMKLFSNAGNNFSSGTIRATGLVAA